MSTVDLNYLEEMIIQVPDKNTLEEGSGAFSWLLIWGRKYQAQISDTNFSTKIKSLVANISDMVVIVIWYKLQSYGNREPQLRNGLHQTGLWVCLWGIFLINNWCGRAQSTLEVVMTGQMVLSSIKKQTEKTTRSKRVSTGPLFLCGLCFGYCHVSL